ncbi:MAG: indole-3-glycerol phosphate synthase TrpC [Clostridia bacterium]|nr:indole-3-glycerol phosphate synthase TrpC [Clostridia bacterium]
MDIMDKIVLTKMNYIQRQKKSHPLDIVRRNAKSGMKVPSFKDALSKPGLSIIGEIKRASPSRGIIDPVFNYIEAAVEYEGCVDAVSVLTEEEHFLGKPEYLAQIKKTINLPILRKDFIIDSYQIFESRVLGASAVLLITAILDSIKLRNFIELTDALGMDSLVEVHNETEVYRALRAGADIIGINNRNLRDFSVDLRNTAKLSSLVPDYVLCVSESGIKTNEDAAYVKAFGVDAVLVGESFMKSKNKHILAKEFRNA